MSSKPKSPAHLHSLFLIAACWLVYMSAYIGRNTFKASIAPVVTAGIMTNEQAGLIETCYFIVYGAGHLINGILADRLNPYKMIGIGLIGSAAANLIMALTPSYPIMLAVWAANGYLQAMLWSPILALFSRAILPELRDLACYRIFTSSPIGTILAYLLVALTADTDYRITFHIAAAFLTVIAIVFLTVSHRAAPHLRDWRHISVPAQAGETSDEEAHPMLPLLLKTGVPMLILATILHGMLKEGVLTWVPSLISDTYPVDVTFSVLLSMLLPLSNLGGAFLSKQAHGKLFHRHEAITAGFFMLLSAIPILAVSRMAQLPLVLSVICLALISLLMTGFNYMVSTVIPMRFSAYGRAATFSGVFNSSVYLGSAISTYLSGSIADRFGWNVTVLVWLGIALGGVLILLPVLRAWGKFIHTDTIRPEPKS